MKKLLSQLNRFLPRGTLRMDPLTLKNNSSDAWMASALPDAVAYPKSTADVSKILSFCHRHRIPLTTRGGGRGYVGGCVPVKGGMVLSLVKMNRILEISPRDGLAVVASLEVMTPGWTTASPSRGEISRIRFILMRERTRPPFTGTQPPT